MILACLAKRNPSPFPEKFQTVYIVSPHPFPEVEDFVVSSGNEYHLEVARYVLPMKKGLDVYLADRPSIKSIFVGTRRTDPHGEKLTHFDRTDPGWPDFMRVHPVIDWHYGTWSGTIGALLALPRACPRSRWLLGAIGGSKARPCRTFANQTFNSGDLGSKSRPWAPRSRSDGKDLVRQGDTDMVVVYPTNGHPLLSTI